MADTALPKAGTGLLQSIVWGLGRSLRHEHLDWAVCLIDVDGSPRDAASQLFAEINSTQPGNEILWRRKKNISLRFKLTLEAEPLPQPEKAPEQDGTWLVTGGLGRVGHLMAERLVERGVRHLALVSRSAPKGDTAKRIEEWRNRGIEIRVGAVDVADAPALSAFVEALPTHWPSLTECCMRQAFWTMRSTPTTGRPCARRDEAERSRQLGSPPARSQSSIRHFILVSSASGLLGNLANWLEPQTACWASRYTATVADFRHKACAGVHGLTPPVTRLLPTTGAPRAGPDQNGSRTGRRNVRPRATFLIWQFCHGSMMPDLLIPCRRHLASNRSTPRVRHDGQPDRRCGLAPERRQDQLTAYILSQIDTITPAEAGAPD